MTAPAAASRVGTSEHTSRPWRIHEIASGFRVEDVWRLPGTGGADDFRALIDALSTFNPLQSRSLVVRNLFAVRQWLGQALGWDDARTGNPPASLLDKVPAELPGAGADLHPLPFRQLYRTDDEWAAESANGTMHGILHLGRVPAGEGRFLAQLAVIVQPNGLLGEAYMALIKPFRYLLVYPRLLNGGELPWPGHTQPRRGVGTA